MLTVFLVAGAAAAASVAGGALALARRPSTLVMSAVLGFASGVLLGTVALEMVPEALSLGSVATVAAGLAVGFLGMWAFDLFVHRGYIAGEHAAQRARVDALHRRRRPRGDEVTVLAGGTSAEELIEGAAIGAGIAVEPELGVLIAAAIAIDNLSEGLSIGELVIRRSGRNRAATNRVLRWTMIVGVSLLVSSIVGFLLLRDAADQVLALLLATGAGGMLYLTVTQLVPPSEEFEYEGSAALATGTGFVMILVLTQAVRATG